MVTQINQIMVYSVEVRYCLEEVRCVKRQREKRIEDKNKMKEKRNKNEKPTQRKMRPGGRLNVVLEGGRVSLSHLLGSLICVLISRNATVGM